MAPLKNRQRFQIRFHNGPRFATCLNNFMSSNSTTNKRFSFSHISECGIARNNSCNILYVPQQIEQVDPIRDLALVLCHSSLFICSNIQMKLSAKDSAGC